ncbi:MAG: hypothetical protein JST87_16525 [Bacteroidetes bacterium]|nr:hypothetical protein [Bacteroidota bacterium]
MVRIIDYKISENSEGKEFLLLKLEGGVEAIQSQKTGQFYLTAKTCFIPSTFSEASAKSLIGTTISGRVVREDCEPYEYTIKETGEVIMLAHSYRYRQEQESSEPVAMIDRVDF